MIVVAAEVLEMLESSAQFFHSTQNFDALHPDGEKSQIFSKLTA